MDRPSSPGIIKSSTIRSMVSRSRMRCQRLAVLGLKHLKAFLGEVTAQQLPDAGVVVNYQDLSTRVGVDAEVGKWVGLMGVAGHAFP